MPNFALTTTSLSAVAQYVDRYAVLAVPDSISDISTLDLGDLEGIVYKGSYYSRNRTTTRPSDGISVLRDANNTAYTIGASQRPTKAKRIENTLPQNPNIGDAFLVGTSPNGVLAGHTDDIALVTLWGVEFFVPEEGDLLYLTDTDETWQFINRNHWRRIYPVGVSANNISNPQFTIVEGIFNSALDLLNPQEGQKGIVGTSPTDAFVNQANNIFVVERNGAYSFIPAVEGMTVRDKQSNVTRTWTGTEWSTEGVESPLIHYDHYRVSPGGFTPAGLQDQGVRRVIWSYTPPSLATHSRFEFPGVISIQPSMSRNVDSNQARAKQRVKFSLTIGARELWSDASQDYVSVPARPWHYANTIIPMGSLDINVGREESNSVAVRWSDESSRTIELAMESVLPFNGADPAQLGQIRRIDAASGVAVSESFYVA